MRTNQTSQISYVLVHYRITAALAAINIAAYVILEILGDTQDGYFMMQHGAMYLPKVMQGEYWRLLSACFLHFGLIHILNNMIVLISAGKFLEDALGHVKYLILYLCAGLGGSALSCLQLYLSGEPDVVAGASGAIFGIIGALLWVVIRHGGRYESLTWWGILLMIAICFYGGVTSGGVDNWGHLGGLLCGFLLSIFLYRKKKSPYYR